MRSIKRYRGFTLTEVMVSVALFTLCAILLAQIIDFNLKVYKKYRLEMELKQNADNLNEQITSEIRSDYALDTANCTASNVVFYRYFNDGYVYRITYAYESCSRTVFRSWYRTDDPFNINGQDEVAKNVGNFTFDYTTDTDPLKPTFNAIVRANTTTVESLYGAENSYKTVTQSKRRVVKQVDKVSVTRED